MKSIDISAYYGLKRLHHGCRRRDGIRSVIGMRPVDVYKRQAQSQSPDFTIPFNRQQLADYLSVDRSALSNELGKMQRDGLLQVNKNHFILKEKE